MVRDDAPTRREAKKRLATIDPDHRVGIDRFRARLAGFRDRGLLNDGQAQEIEHHLLRLAERNRNPANTGNLEDLFCYTLEDTQDAIRAYAQALADSVKVVPMDESAQLNPPLRSTSSGKVYRTVGDLEEYDAGEKMLITHTMVAYGDEEMLDSCRQFVRASIANATPEDVEREVAKMAVQSQHGPSSTFILARTHGLTLELEKLYRRAGYDDQQIADAQRFYDICATFSPEWAEPFLAGRIPESAAWTHWRTAYLEARAKLPSELIYQLSSDTLTNFLSGTLESGKWIDAAVYFGTVEQVDDVPKALAAIVNQYVAEHIALHDRPAAELTRAIAKPLAPWGIGFEEQRAVAIAGRPEKFERIRAQFEAAWDRKRSAK